MKNDFKLLIEEIRKRKGLSQSEMARLLKISQPAFSQFEKGIRIPSLERLVEFAQILNVTLDELVEFERIHHKYSQDLLNKTKK